MFWQISANDDYPTVGAQGNASAVANYETTANRRIGARLLVWEAQPLYPERFARIPGIGVADSQEIFRAFQTAGFLDANNYLRRNPTELNWRSLVPARLSATLDAVDRQLQVTYAAHEFSSDGNQALLDLFLSAAGKRTPLAIVSGAALGQAVAKIRTASRRWTVPLVINGVAPGIFTANGDGRGVPAATLLRVPAEGERSNEVVFRLDAQSGRWVPAPIRFREGDRLFLDLYGTGIRQAGTLGTQVLLDNTSVRPLYADAQSQYPGLDQITLEIPPSFSSAGSVTVTVVTEGVRSNSVELLFNN